MVGDVGAGEKAIVRLAEKDQAPVRLCCPLRSDEMNR